MPAFTPERPRRVLVTHAEANGRSAFLFRARDALPLEPVLAQIPGVRSARADWPSFEVYEPSPSHEVAGPAPDFAPPSLELLSSTPNADGTRTVQLRLRSQTPNLRLFVEKGRVAGWSVHPEVAEPPLAGDRATIYSLGEAKDLSGPPRVGARNQVWSARGTLSQCTRSTRGNPRRGCARCCAH